MLWVMGARSVVLHVIGVALINLAAEVLANGISEALVSDIAVGNITMKRGSASHLATFCCCLIFGGFHKQKQHKLQYRNVWQIHVHFIGTSRRQNAGVGLSAASLDS